jgi:hypothetical protein
MKIQSLTISEVEASQEKEVWCLNTSGSENASEIMFQCHGRNNTISVMVPLTFVAICLTEQISKEYLIDSENFRRAVTHGGITLISKAQAEKINSAVGAAEEIERVRSMQVNVGVMESIDTITGKRTRLQKAGRDDDKTTKGDDVVNNKVISIIHDDIEEMDKVNRLRAIRTVLTEADARYIRKEATKAGWKLLIKSANQILSSLTG